MERGLDTPEGDGVSHGRFDEVGQGFARLEHGLELSAQLWLDPDLGYYGGLHERSVLRLSYARNELRWCAPSTRRQRSLAGQELPLVKGSCRVPCMIGFTQAF
jgi:hypothetical protein